MLKLVKDLCADLGRIVAQVDAAADKKGNAFCQLVLVFFVG